MNILLITSDQHRGDCLAVSKAVAGQDAAASRRCWRRTGTRFSACIAPNLICQPTRTSILTGLLPNTHGASDNGVDLDPKVRRS